MDDLRSKGFDPQWVDPSRSHSFDACFGSLTQVRSSRSILQSSEVALTYLSGERAELKNPLMWAAVFVDKKNAENYKQCGALLIQVQSPEAACDFILRHITCPEWYKHHSHKTPDLRERFPDVYFEDPENTIVGPFSEIGAGTVIESGVRIGARVKIGVGTRVGSGTRISDDCELGSFVQITGLCSLGGQGFGFLKYPQELDTRQRLHVGRVIVKDRVRLGAFVAVDRGVFEDTIIQEGAALDNFVQVAHNCEVGLENRLCAFVGLSGSTILGSHVTMAGMVATKGHLKVGDRCVIAGHSGLTTDLEPGSVVKGYPPRPLPEALKIAALQTKLPEIYDRLRALEKSIGRKA